MTDETRKRLEALKNDTKLGFQFVERHEGAIVAAFERLDGSDLPQSGPLSDTALFMVRKLGHYAYDASADGHDRDALFLFGLSVDHDTFRAWDWDGDLVDAYTAAQEA